MKFILYLINSYMKDEETIFIRYSEHPFTCIVCFGDEFIIPFLCAVSDVVSVSFIPWPDPEGLLQKALIIVDASL
jgi:hypothetical protein